MSYFRMWEHTPGSEEGLEGSRELSWVLGLLSLCYGTIPVEPSWPLKVMQLCAGPVESGHLLKARKAHTHQTTVRNSQELSQCPRWAPGSGWNRLLCDPCMVSFYPTSVCVCC